MKKFTAIAIIMVMAIAAVFAAENEVPVTGPSTIELNFGITPVFKPVFAVKYDKGNELADGATVSVLRSDVTGQDAQGQNVNLAKVSKTDNASELKMAYAGGGVARQYAAKQIGTFTVAWTADKLAPAQNYSSTITINATAR